MATQEQTTESPSSPPGGGAPPPQQQELQQKEPAAPEQPAMPETRPEPTSSGLARPPVTPFTVMRRLFDEVDRMVALATNPADLRYRTDDLGWSPLIEVTRRDGRIVVSADLPGLAHDDIQLSVDADELIIEGERHAHERDDDVWHSERDYGRFRRVVRMPAGTQADTIEARLENGVLEISVPIAQERRRTISVQTSDGKEATKVTIEEPTEAHASDVGGAT